MVCFCSRPQAAQRQLTIEEQAEVMDDVLACGSDVVLERLWQRLRDAGCLPPGITVQYADLSVKRYVHVRGDPYPAHAARVASTLDRPGQPT